MKNNKVLRISYIMLFLVIFTSCNRNEGMSVREVVFQNVDLNEMYWGGESWETFGTDVHGEVDLSPFIGQEINNREYAEVIANVILTQQQMHEVGDYFILTSISHDSVQNIWLFGYDRNLLEPILGSSLFATVDGNTGEFLRTWWD